MPTLIDKSNEIDKINETCQSSTSPVKKIDQSRFEIDDQSPEGKRCSAVPLPCQMVINGYFSGAGLRPQRETKSCKSRGICASNPSIHTSVNHPSSERPVIASERSVLVSERAVVYSDRPTLDSERPVLYSERPVLASEQKEQKHRFFLCSTGFRLPLEPQPKKEH